MRRGRRFQCAEVSGCDNELRDVCACGLLFASHGAGHPHTRGDECQGFAPAKHTPKARAGRQPKESR